MYAFNAIFGNAIVYDKCIKLKNFSSNRALKKLANRFGSIDSIRRFDEFAAEVRTVKSCYKGPMEFKCFNKEALLYGHASSLYRYAYKEFTSSVFMPKIEHGVNFSEDSLYDNMIFSLPALIFQGSYKREMVHKVQPGKPVFCIGPYIRYADNYYSREEFVQLKKQLGKVITIFPCHTYEKSSAEYERENFVDSILERYSGNYDTIMICVYWNDIDDPVYNIFQKKGAKLVSAGIRFDDSFISRLKTIIALSDMISGNDVGTFVGYALSMNKSVELLETDIIETDIMLSEEGEKRSRINKKAVMDAVNGGKREEIEKVLDPYWGLSYRQFSPREIGVILNLTEEIVRRSSGRVVAYGETIRKLCEDYMELDGPEAELIKYAVSQ